MADPTSVYFTGDGSTTDRNLPFPYLSRSHVKATVNGVPASITFINQNTVRFSPAPAAGATGRVYRDTPKTPIITWEDGVVILGRDMNAGQLQTIYIAEEAYNYANGIAEEAKQFALDSIQTTVDARLTAAVGTLANTIEGPAGIALAASNNATNQRAVAEAARDEAVAARLGAEDALADATDRSDAALAAYLAMRKLYLGGKTTDPTVDNEGAPLQTGALYFNTALGKMKIWGSGVWTLAYNSIEVPPAQTAGDVQNDSGVTGPTVKDALNTLKDGLAGKANTTHGHAIGDVSGLQSALDGKAPTSHTHTIANVTGLQGALDGKLGLGGGTLTGRLNTYSLTWGRAVNLTADVDLDTITASGFYDCFGNPNAPDAVSWWHLQVMGHSNNPTTYSVQIAYSFTGRTMLRYKSNAPWTPWVEMVNATYAATQAQVRLGTGSTVYVSPKSLLDRDIEITLPWAASLNTNLTLGTNLLLTMTGNATLLNPIGGMTSGRQGRIRIVQDGTGGRLLTYGSFWDFEGGTAPALSTAPSAEDYLDYEVVHASKIRARLSKAWS